MKRFLPLVIIITMVSCQKDELIELRDQNAWEIILPDTTSGFYPIIPLPNVETGITLGDRLENPYSVTNMRAAYNDNTIRPKLAAAGLDEDDITTTHFYIKFKPDNEEELQLLKQRYVNQEIYEYPLDYEISGRISYHDPALPDTVPTYQYMSIDSLSWNTIVRPDNVDYEVLERLFIPDEDLEVNIFAHTLSSNTMSYEEAIETLVNTSLMLTGNLDDDTTEENGQMDSGGTWYPSGRITAYDDIIDGQVPLQGVKVRARRWFTTHTAITDENGYFSCTNGFKRPANYSIVWEGDMWDIRDGDFVQAYYNGPKIEGEWNLSIPNNNDRSLRYSAIHRAVYRMMEGVTGGLSRPTLRQKISYLHKEGDCNGKYYCEIGLGIFCDIRIYGKENGVWRSIHNIISTTFHELGHAAHFTNNIIEFPFTKRVIQESWANFVGYYLVLKEYFDLGLINGPFDVRTYNADYQSNVYYVPDKLINYQLMTITGDHLYTPLFIDMYDNNNQYVTNIIYDVSNTASMNYYPQDEIYNISAEELEDMAFSSRTISDFKTELKNLYELIVDGSANNLSLETINKYFELYETYY